MGVHTILNFETAEWHAMSSYIAHCVTNLLHNTHCALAAEHKIFQNSLTVLHVQRKLGSLHLIHTVQNSIKNRTELFQLCTCAAVYWRCALRLAIDLLLGQ